MRTRIAAAVAAVLFGVAAPISSAMAFSETLSGERWSPRTSYQARGIEARGVHDHPRFTGCPASSAAEGNARQQNFPVKQYGQTAGGNLC